MGLSHSPRIVTNGLVYCIDPGNKKSLSGQGSLSIKDLTGKNDDSNISITGEGDPLATYTSENGGCVLLDGLGTDVLAYNDANIFSNDNSITVSVFVNIDEATKDTGSGLICSQRYQTESNAGGYGFVIPGTTYGSSTTLAVNLTKDVSGTQTSYQIIAPFTYVRQEFRYYTFTYNSSTKTVSTYMNGVLQNSSTNLNYAWTPNIVFRKTTIGSNPQGGWSTKYKMKVGVVQVYNRVLSELELQQNFNSFRGRYGI